MTDPKMTLRTPDGALVEWPEGVPQDFTELVQQLGPYIEKRVKRYNKIDRNYDDLCQHIWEKLMTSDLLVKFVTAAASKVVEVTAEQAIGYLGISKGQWSTMVFQRLDRPEEFGWLPAPVNKDADPYDTKTAYHVRDIVLVDETGYFSVQSAERVYLKTSKKGFKSYLQRAIRNHWANWCRTHSRRYKEQLLTPNTVLSANTDGSFRTAAHLEEFTSWESTLVASSFDDSAIIDTIAFADELRDAFVEADLDLGSIHATEDYVDKDGKVRQRPTPAARKGLEILDYVAQGYSITEAIAVQGRHESRQRVKARVRTA